MSWLDQSVLVQVELLEEGTVMAHAVQLTIAELMRRPAGDVPPDPANPFVVDDLLVEADLQKVQWDVAAGECWMLFDLKGSFQYPAANTAVLAVDGVQSFEWTGAPPHQPGAWGTFMVMGSMTEFDNNSIRFTVGGLDGGKVSVRGAEMNFWTGGVPGGDDAPPDYTQDDPETIRAGLANWNSLFTPMTFTPGRRPRAI